MAVIYKHLKPCGEVFYKMCPKRPRAVGSLERGGKEKRIERFKETGK